MSLFGAVSKVRAPDDFGRGRRLLWGPMREVDYPYGDLHGMLAEVGAPSASCSEEVRLIIRPQSATLGRVACEARGLPFHVLV